MTPARYAVVAGTRPEFVKLAAFYKRVEKEPRVSLFSIHTGQHFDANMSNIFYSELGLPAPDVSLAVPEGSFSKRLGGMLSMVEQTLAPHAGTLSGVIVLGDVNSVLAGALAGAHLGIPVIHIEAGLRSDDHRMPEETNRIITDHVSTLLFTTEEAGNQHLAHEGIRPDRVHFVGNLGIESFELFRDRIDSIRMREKLAITGPYLVSTIHRQEHTTDPVLLRRIFAILRKLSEDRQIIMPLHPGTRRRLQEYGIRELGRMRIIEPLGYFEFMSLLTHSAGVLTDSGGIQEETSHLGIPCCTLRDNTERPVTVELGSNKLFPSASINEQSIVEMEQHLARNDFKASAIPLWDGRVSERILAAL